jgi:antirestriction protein ArdC
MLTKNHSSGQDKIYEMVTSRIIEELEKGLVPWRRPWNGCIEGFPQNFINKKEYRGINVFLLSMAMRSTPYWLTFKQAKQLKGRIRKGEKGFPVIFWKWIEVEDKDNDKKKNVPLLRYYTVFNLDQCEDIELPEDEKPETREFNPIDQAEKIIFDMPNKPVITHNEARAYYRPHSDTVNMPKQELFLSDSEYYSTLFHELTHSTGHESRLDRESERENHNFGMEDYSKEELIAEMGSAFLCAEAGIAHETIKNSAAYIDGWLNRLRKDKKILVQAAGKAQKAADFILNRKTEWDN